MWIVLMCLFWSTVDPRPFGEVTQITLKFFDSNFVQIFRDGDDLSFGRGLLVSSGNDPFSGVVENLMREIRWSFQTADTSQEILPERLQTKNPKVRNILVILEDITKLDKLAVLVKQTRVVNFESRVLVLCRGEDVNNIFRIFWREVRAIRLGVVSVNKNVEFFTWSPYESGEILRVSWGEIFMKNAVPRDFKAFPIKAGIDFMEPYVFRDATGLEIEILKIIAGCYNFTFVLIPARKGENSRIVFNGNKTSGLFGMLYRNEIDVAFAGMMRNPDRFSVSEVVYPHTEDRLLWCYPRPVAEISWTSLYRSFSFATWALIGSFILINATVICLLGRETRETVFQRFSDCLLAVWGVTLDAGFPASPKSSLFRFFIMAVFFYVIILSCLYKSCLVTFLTTPEPGKPLNSLFDALDQGFDLRMHVSAKQSITADDKFWSRVLIPGRFEFNQNTDDNLAAVAFNRTVVYLSIFYTTEYVQSAKFLDPDGRPLIVFFRDTFNTFSTSMFLSPGHPLEGLFNLKTMQLVESGIIYFFLKRILDQVKQNTMREKIRLGTVGSRSGPKPLALQHLFIVFVAIGIALFVCFLLFISEILLNLYRKKRCNKKGRS